MKLLIGNFKGPQGEPGNVGQTGAPGPKGEPGDRGSRWTSGTAITGTNTEETIFADSGITDAAVDDYYLNTTTGNLYQCTASGAADTAKWVYIGNFKGPKGNDGPAGSISDINDQIPTYTEATQLENIESGETVKIAFGKLKKALSVFIVHHTQKATAAILGHVKLSNSAAITKAGEYALDAIEKNATIEGTLAHIIDSRNNDLTNSINQLNSNMVYKAGDIIGNSSTLMWLYGTITSGGREIYTFIPFNKPIVGTCTMNLIELVIRDNNTYVFDSYTNDDVKIVKCDILNFRNSGLYLKLYKEGGVNWNAVMNNNILSVAIKFAVTIS